MPKVRSKRREQSESSVDHGSPENEKQRDTNKSNRKKVTQENKNKHRRSSSSCSASSNASSPKRTKNKSDNRSKWDSPVRNNKKRVNSRNRSRSNSPNNQQRVREDTRYSRDGRKRQEYESKYERDRNDDRNQRIKDERHNKFRNDNNKYRDRRDDYDDRKERSGGGGRYNEYRDRSRSPTRNIKEHKYERYNRRSRSRNRQEDDQHQNYSWGKKSSENEKRTTNKQEDKEKPNFGLSGALTEDTNKVNGVVIKYSEPPEARRPKRRWRLYPFKGENALPVLHIHRQSCFLVGRDRKVVDLAVDHPSCSKQHAALQYRLVNFKREDGSQGKRVRLYLIDLDSANGTFLNNNKIEPRKYYELLEKDVVKFGFSTREYVLLHENSKEDQEDDDISIKEEPEEQETDSKETKD